MFHECTPGFNKIPADETFLNKIVTGFPVELSNFATECFKLRVVIGALVVGDPVLGRRPVCAAVIGALVGEPVRGRRPVWLRSCAGYIADYQQTTVSLRRPRDHTPA